jgi:hypothetical protein
MFLREQVDASADPAARIGQAVVVPEVAIDVVRVIEEAKGLF